MGLRRKAQTLAAEPQPHSTCGAELGEAREDRAHRTADRLRISANVTGDFGNVTDPGLGAGLRG